MLRRERDERQVHERRAIGQRELAPGDVRIEPYERLERADPLREILLRPAFCFLGNLSLEKGRTIEPARDELHVQLHELDQLAHLRTLEWVARQERLLRKRFLEVLGDHLRLGQAPAAVELEERHLADGRAREKLVVL